MPTPSLTRSVRIAYGGCPAGQVILSVTAPARAVPWLVPLRYTVRLDNTGRDRVRSFGGPIAGASGR